MPSFRAIFVAVPVLAVVSLGAAACSMGDPASARAEESVNARPRPVETVPTFAGTIESILQEKCQRCHAEGGIAPFALVTYEDIKGIAALAKEKVVSKEMPPWGAFDDDTCKTRHKFKDDLRLTDEELSKLVGWIDNGMPRGNEGDRPPPVHFAPAGLEGKTHSLTMATPYQVEAAGGRDDIRCFPIDPGFKADTWIGGTNVVPGNPQVVHHVIVFIDPNGEGPAAAAGKTSYPCFGGPKVSNPSLLMAWAPGITASTYGEDTGLKIPKNARLVMQVHYHPSSQRSVSDQTKFELKVIEGKPSYVAQLIPLGNAENDKGPIKLLPGPDDPATGPAFLIPANLPAHTESMEVVLPDTVSGFALPELKLAAIGTHMHWAGVDMKVEIERRIPLPTQPAKECLVGTPKYDFNWQRGYAFDEKYDDLPTANAGDKLTFSCKYDNTMNNKHIRKALAEQQKASPSDIHLGEETLDEMCIGILLVLRRATLVD